MEDNDAEPQPISKSHENFLRDFIKTYRENRILWDKNHPKYKSRGDRDAAFDDLVYKTREYFPDANIDFVKSKIDSIRGTFRREHRKVLNSKKNAKSDDDIYVPSLWYYNFLLFVTGEELGDEFDITKDDTKPIIYSWSKHHSVILIELLKKYPILYSLESLSAGNKSKRTKAYKDITNELIAEVGIHFEVYEVKNKINTLKQQFRRECRLREQKRTKKPSKLWCYDLLMFLRDASSPKKLEVVSEEEQDLSDEDTENLWINYEADSDTDKKEPIFHQEDQDDIFDTIGKNIAMKLRDLDDDQRIYAENLINEVLYHAMMGNLTADSRLSLNGE